MQYAMICGGAKTNQIKKEKAQLERTYTLNTLTMQNQTRASDDEKWARIIEAAFKRNHPQQTPQNPHLVT